MCVCVCVCVQFYRHSYQQDLWLFQSIHVKSRMVSNSKHKKLRLMLLEAIRVLCNQEIQYDTQFRYVTRSPEWTFLLFTCSACTITRSWKYNGLGRRDIQCNLLWKIIPNFQTNSRKLEGSWSQTKTLWTVPQVYLHVPLKFLFFFWESRGSWPTDQMAFVL